MAVPASSTNENDPCPSESRRDTYVALATRHGNREKWTGRSNTHSFATDVRVCARTQGPQEGATTSRGKQCAPTRRPSTTCSWFAFAGARALHVRCGYDVFRPIGRVMALQQENNKIASYNGRSCTSPASVCGRGTSWGG